MSQPWGYSCQGGLNVNLNQLEMLKQPGFATKLKNFEVDPDGGYRRVSGYTLFGDTLPNSSNSVLGMAVYADGIVVCSGTGIFFSTDGEDTWLQVNRASVDAAGDNYSTFTGRSVAARTSQGRCTFAIYEGNSDYGELVICDGVNEPFLFQMTGTGGLTSRTFFAKEITVSSTIGPAYAAIHDKHLVVAGASAAKNTVYYSGTNDIDSFSSTGSGSIVIEDQVEGLSSFRDDLIIFCSNSIHKLININDSSNIAIVPITKNVGCVNGGSIQEIGGDLVFLAPDGIRTIAGTARIGDVELGSVSRQIQSIITDIVSDSGYIITSGVLRSKSQYRLFYSKTSENPTLGKGIIGTLTGNGFSWSETQGIQALGFTSDLDKDGIEKVYHGDKDGYIYNHDTGSSFYSGGSTGNITATYQTPDFDFGDIGTRKTLKYARISFSPEGECSPTFRLRFDYENTDTPQPEPVEITTIDLPAIFGSSTFNSANFGATSDPMERITLEGSGNTCSFRISSEDQKSSYAVNGIYIDYMPVGRR
tara:strand:+ start:871 stop:2466 length:1596 start_codon:yes stop_codon:yes gene_type:complete